MKQFEPIDQIELYKQFRNEDRPAYKLESIATEELLADATENLVDIGTSHVLTDELRAYCELTAQEIELDGLG